MFLHLTAAHGTALAGSIHAGESPRERDAATAGMGAFHWAAKFFAW